MAEEEAPKKKGGGILIPALLITLIAGGGGAAFGMLVLGPGSGGGGAQHAAADTKHKSKDKKKGKKDKHVKKGDGEAEAKDVSEHETIIALPTIVANLNNSSKHWLRIETSIIAKAGTEPISLVTQKRLAQDIFAHIRHSRLEEFEGASGLINLRSDLSDVVRIRTKGRAEEVVVHGMIVE
ncbi:MAG: hypothetical protein ACR2PI_24195 [Hyphomicrobiaceae bacterium]